MYIKANDYISLVAAEFILVMKMTFFLRPLYTVDQKEYEAYAARWREYIRSVLESKIKLKPRPVVAYSHVPELDNISLPLLLRPILSLQHFFATLRLFKNVILSLLVASLFILYSAITFKFALLKVFGGWSIVLLFAYWLLSGFNFFLKRYRYGKYTSSLQRFWKRAIMCFWLIEGFLFLLFFYYMLNSSQEPTFMYDQVYLYNFQVLPPKNMFFTFALITVAIFLLNILLIQIKFSTLRQVIPTIFICTLIYIYFLLSEAYQFYYVINFYDDSIFVFSEDENLWELESDSPRTRIKNNFLTLTILAKFWHYIFIFASWAFFVMKTFEYRRTRYNLLSLNLQNFILFYIMAWLCTYNWFKWLFRRFLDVPYYWFFTTPRNDGLTILVYELYRQIKSIPRFFFSDNYVSLNLLPNADFAFTRGSLLRWSLYNSF